MSKQVDERVVSMQFDNRNFEKNVHTSMSTLEKLKQKLNLSGAAKGLDNLNASARKVDMSSLGNGVEAVRSKFSALEVIGVTALANITNSAVNAGKRIISALTIDPVKTGLQEYETQINATQTILANTAHQGTTLDDVNKALDELNKYADLTIYNFTEMTKNIGTFTAAGLDLDTSIKGIQGIANLAAVSGSNSQQASMAMYQLSQALAAGKVSLQDWNSVVNAGMGGKIFQNALARTAKDFGNSVAFDAIEAGETFRNLLNPKDYGDWLTSDVLSATLSKFTKTGAVEYLSDLYSISSDSIQELQKLGDTTGYNSDEFNKLALSLANGNQETAKYITDTLSMADTATKAATEVKTLSQLWDTLKETAQSGWTQTWELIIGDFDQAKKLFSGLYNFFSSIIEKSSDFRNKLVGGAMGNPFSDFIDKINNSAIGKTVDKVNKLAMSLDEYQKVVNQVWHGDYQNAPVRYDLLDEAGYNHQVIQDLVNKGLDYKLTIDNVAESEKKFGVSVEETTKSIENLSDEQLKNAGLTEEEIRVYRDLEKQSKKTGKSIQELVDDMGKKDGRTLLLEGLKNIGMSIVTVLKSIKEAWIEVFPPPTVIQLYNLISGFNEFSQKLKISGETAGKLKKTFKGLFSILHIITTVVGGALTTAFNIIKQVLGAFNLNILDATAAIGDAIVSFDEWLTGVLDFGEAIKKIVPYLTDAWKSAKEWASGIKDADNIPKYIIEGLVKGLVEGVKLVGQAAIELGKALLEKIKNFLGINSPSTEFIEVGQNIVSGLVIGIQNGASIVWETLKGIVTKGFELIKSINWGTILAAALSGGMVFAIIKIAKALEKLASPIEGIGDVLSGAGEALEGFGKYLKGLAFSVKVNAIKNLVLAISLLVGAVIVLTFIDKGKLWDAVAILGAITGILALLVGVVSGLAILSNKFGAGKINFSAITLGLIGISASLLILATVVKRMGNLDPEQAKHGFIGLTGLIVELSVLMAAYGLLVKGKAAQNVGNLGKTLLKISIALLILVGVIKLIANMSTRDLTKGLVVIGILGLFFTALIRVSQLAGKNATKAGSMLLQISAALLIMTAVIKLIAGMAWDELGKGVAGLAVLTVFILALVLITKLGGKSAPKLGTMLLAMASAMFILAVVIKLISGMEWSELAKGVVGIVILGLIVSGLVAVAATFGGKSAKIATMLLAMAVAIGILAGIAVLLGMVDIKSLAKGIIAVGILAAMISLMVHASKGATASVGSIVVLAAAVGVLAGALVALSFVDTDKLLSSAIALTAVMTAFALMTASASLLKDTNKLVGKLAPLVGVVAILAAILGIMAVLDIELAIETAGSLALLLTAMSAALAILNFVGPNAKSGVGAMALMGLVVGELAVVIGLMEHFNVNPSIETAGALSILLTSMSASLVLLSVAGKLGPAAFIGIGALATLIAGIGGLIVGIGALVEEFPKLEEFLNTGIPMIEKIGTAIGSFFGNIISGFIGGIVTGALPVIGQDLSDFMANLKPFIEGSKNIDTKVIDGVKTLAETILILTGANILEGIGSWITGSSSIDTFGQQLPKLGTYLNQFVTNLGTFGEDQIATISCAANAIKEMAIAADQIPNEGGWAAAILGDNSITSFGSQLPSLGLRLNQFATNLGTFGNDQINSISCAANAIKEMAIAADKIPNEGGWAAAIFGENSIAKFGSELPSLGTNLNSFAANLGAFTEAQVSSIACAAKAVTEMAKASTGVDGQAGWAKALFGDNSIATFSTQFPTLGTNLNEFVTNLGTFGDAQIDTVSSAVKAVNTLSDLANSNIKGAKKNLEGFGDNIVALAEDMSSFVSGMPSSGGLTMSIENVEKILSMIDDISGSDANIATNFTKSLSKIGKDGVDKFVEAFTSSSAKTNVKEAAVNLIQEIIKGVESKLSDIKDSFEKVAKSGIDSVKDVKSSFYDAGKYLVEGFAAGITETTWKVEAEAKAMAKAAAEAAKKELKEHSPSKVFNQIGDYAGQGFVNALSDYGDKSYAASSKMALSAKKGLSDSISKIKDVIGSDIDAQPTIRPVLDLSNLRTGMNAVNGLFNTRESLGVVANVGAINARMNRNIQNGTNSEVVSAINQLRKDLGENVGNVYNIDGITYDDGSNISEVVKELVRAARVERRR